MSNQLKKSLEEIVKKNDFVLIDTNIDRLSHDDSGVIIAHFDATTFTNIEEEDIIPYINHFRFLNGLIHKYNNIYAVQEVIGELKIYEKNLHYKWVHLKERCFQNKYNKYNKKGGGFRSRNKLKIMQELDSEMSYLIKNKSIIFKPSQESKPIYDALVGCIQLLDLNIGLKLKKTERINGHERRKERMHKLYNPQKNKKEKTNNSIKQETDEKIVACALYAVIVNNKNTAIISNDKDITRLLKVSYELISCLAHPRGCFKELKEKEIGLYCLDKKHPSEYSEILNTKDIEIPKEFKIRKIKNPEVNKEIKNKIIRKMALAEREVIGIKCYS